MLEIASPQSRIIGHKENDMDWLECIAQALELTGKGYTVEDAAREAAFHYPTMNTPTRISLVASRVAYIINTPMAA